MAWDTEGTKRRILEAATAQFVAKGPDGTTIEKVARESGVNKERVYNYFRGKSGLFEAVLREQVVSAAAAVPVPTTGPDDLGEYAGLLYDYLQERPELMRLLMWEALTMDEVVDESDRRAMYADRTADLARGQATGALSGALDPDLLNVLILGIVGYWSMLPQVSCIITGGDSEAEQARRRAAVVEAARRMGAP